MNYDVFLYDRVAGTRTLVSHSSSSLTTAANSNSFGGLISADGNFVAFGSHGTDLVPNQSGSNTIQNVFLYDRATGKNTLVSHSSASASTSGNDDSFFGSISSDGRFVDFTSKATNLVNGQVDSNNTDDVFLFDRLSGGITLVSHASGSVITTGNDVCDLPIISADGSFIAYASLATNLVAGQNGMANSANVFLYDRSTGATTLVSRKNGTVNTTGNGESFPEAISGDGNTIAFQSFATDLVPGFMDGNGLSGDLFTFNRTSGTTTLVTHIPGSSSASANNKTADFCAISANGRFLAYSSLATNLVASQNDQNNANDVFLYDLSTQINTLVSHASGSNNNTANSSSTFVGTAISADGSFIAYESLATNLIPGQNDADNAYNSFLYNRTTGANSLVSHSSASITTTGIPGLSNAAGISADGSFLAFTSLATNLVSGVQDLNNQNDVFLYSKVADTNSLISVRNPSLRTPSASSEPSESSDGRYVAFASTGQQLPGQVFLRDRTTGITTLVSHSSLGADFVGNADSDHPAISADGRFVAFASKATNLVANQTDTNAATDIFLYDRTTGTISLASHIPASMTTTGDHASFSPVFSGDDSFVVFVSNATNLVTGQNKTAAVPDIYLYNRATGQITLVDHVAGLQMVPDGGANSTSPVMSADGKFIAFQSLSRDLSPNQNTNGLPNVFLYDRVADTITLLSHSEAPNPPNLTANDFSGNPTISADGTFIAFESAATDLISPIVEGNAQLPDIFLYNRLTGTLTLVSHISSSLNTTGNNASENPILSSDGSSIAFTSMATDLVAGQTDANNGNDVFLYNRLTGSVQLVSHTSASAAATGDGASTNPVLSADGSAVVFQSLATNLVPGQSDSNAATDVFRYDRATGAIRLMSRNRFVSTTTGDSASDSAVISGDGSTVAFTSSAEDLLPGDFKGQTHVFVFTASPDDLAGRVQQSGQWWIAQSTGSSFTNALWTTWNPAATWVDTLTGDFNGDGKADIIARDLSSGNWWIGLSTGSGFSVNLWTTWSSAVTWVDVQVGDLNGDGRADIIGRVLQTGDWWVSLSNGSNVLSTTLWTNWSPAVTWVDVRIGDLNADGKADVIGRVLQSGQWWASLSNGSTALSTSLWATWSTAVTWVDVRIGDLNGDGKADIIGRVLQSGQWWAGLSNGSTALSTSLWATWSPAVTWVDVRIGDLDGDGKADIIGRVLQSGQWWVSLSAGSTSSSTTLWATWSPAVTWADVQIGDFNGDGLADITGRDLASGNWWTGLSNGSAFTTSKWASWSTAVTWVDVRAGQVA
jgi:hypothetical protein